MHAVWTCAGPDLKLPSSSGTTRSTDSSKRKKGESTEENDVSDRVLSHSTVEKENPGIDGCGIEKKGELPANPAVRPDGEEGDEKVEEEVKTANIKGGIDGALQPQPVSEEKPLQVDLTLCPETSPLKVQESKQEASGCVEAEAGLKQDMAVARQEASGCLEVKTGPNQDKAIAGQEASGGVEVHTGPKQDMPVARQDTVVSEQDLTCSDVVGKLNESPGPTLPNSRRPQTRGMTNQEDEQQLKMPKPKKRRRSEVESLSPEVRPDKKESMKAREDGRQAKPAESDKGKKIKKSKKEREKSLPLLAGNAKEDETEEPKVKNKKNQHKR
jgi:hypothetical protein